MALKVKAKEKLLKFSKQSEGTWRYVMVPDLYSSLAQDKVIRCIANHIGIKTNSQRVCQLIQSAAYNKLKFFFRELFLNPYTK